MADYRKEGGGRGPDEGRGVATVKASGALRRPVRPCRAVDADARLCSTCPPCSVLVPSFALPSFGFACVPRFGFLVGAHTHTHTHARARTLQHRCDISVYRVSNSTIDGLQLNYRPISIECYRVF